MAERTTRGDAARRRLLTWAGGRWVVCGDTGTAHNTSTATRITLQRFWGDRPCGNGYYEGETIGYAFDNGRAEWKGASVRSGTFLWNSYGGATVVEHAQRGAELVQVAASRP